MVGLRSAYLDAMDQTMGHKPCATTVPESVLQFDTPTKNSEVQNEVYEILFGGNLEADETSANADDTSATVLP